MSKAAPTTFQTTNVTHQGRRGRPAHAKTHRELTLAISNSKGKAMGTVAVLAGDDGTIKLVAKSNGTTRALTFEVETPVAAPKVEKAAKTEPAPVVPETVTV